MGFPASCQYHLLPTAALPEKLGQLAIEQPHHADGNREHRQGLDVQRNWPGSVLLGGRQPTDVDRDGSHARGVVAVPHSGEQEDSPEGSGLGR